MDAGEEERMRETLILAVIAVLAAMAVSALCAATAYYCYIRNKVSMRRKSLNCKILSSLIYSPK